MSQSQSMDKFNVIKSFVPHKILVVMKQNANSRDHWCNDA